jgi:polysaccharide export outer membrane protein
MRVFFLMMFIVLFSTEVFAEDYVIGDGDSLTVSVWGSPELSIQTTVRPDGKISIPALGEVRASGFTPVELKKLLEKEMKKLVKTPIITVIVTSMTNYRIFIIGTGVKTGLITLTRETTLLQLLAQIGPFNNADLKNAYLMRDKKNIKTDFSSLFEKGDSSQDILLKPNDTLFIPDNFEKRISVIGAVNNPSTIQFREGHTILDVILAVGGFTEFANKNSVTILRKNGEEERTEISVKAKDLMKGDLSVNVTMVPGDIVVVRESIF